jgi:hypothetical protein
MRPPPHRQNEGDETSNSRLTAPPLSPRQESEKEEKDVKATPAPHHA